MRIFGLSLPLQILSPPALSRRHPSDSSSPRSPCLFVRARILPPWPRLHTPRIFLLSLYPVTPSSAPFDKDRWVDTPRLGRAPGAGGSRNHGPPRRMPGPPRSVPLTRQSTRIRSRGPGLTVASCLPAVPPCVRPPQNCLSGTSFSPIPCFTTFARCCPLLVYHTLTSASHFCPVTTCRLRRIFTHFVLSPKHRNIFSCFSAFILARCAAFCRVALFSTRPRCRID